MPRTILAILLLTLLSSLIPASSQEPEFAKQVDALVEPYLASETVLGLTVGIIKDGEEWTRGYGSVAAGRAVKPDGDTLYEIGSITKTFTGLLLADVVVREQVTLETPIGKLLPKSGNGNQRPAAKITLKQLATHTSGLPRLPSNLAPANPLDPYADYDDQRLYTFLENAKLEAGPGTKSAYSNLGFGLLGTLLARMNNTSYEALLEERIFKPLRMSDTTVALSAAERDRLAAPYDANLSANNPWNFRSMAGAGAIRSTTNDMLRYAAAHLSPPEGQIGEAIELAWQIHQPPLDDKSFAMGLGWHVARDGNTRWHNGQTGGYHSTLFISRPSSAAVVVLSNTATMEVDVLAEQLIRMAAGANETPRTFPKTADVDEATMRKLVGVYQLAPQVQITVKVEDGNLMVGLTGQPSVRVYPQSATEWKYRIVDASLTFKLDESGKSQSVVLHQFGREMPAKRVE